MATWDDGVYEPIRINPQTALANGIVNGNRVLVSNDRGRSTPPLTSPSACAERRPHGPGFLHQLNSAGIDVGGCVNTLTTPGLADRTRHDPGT